MRRGKRTWGHVYGGERNWAEGGVWGIWEKKMRNEGGRNIGGGRRLLEESRKKKGIQQRERNLETNQLRKRTKEKKAKRKKEGCRLKS